MQFTERVCGELSKKRAISKGDSIPPFNGGGDDDESAALGGRIITIHFNHPFSSLYAASAESGAAPEVGDVPARRAGVVVARLHADVGAGQAAAVHRRHRRLQVHVQAHDLRLLQPWKGGKTLYSAYFLRGHSDTTSALSGRWWTNAENTNRMNPEQQY